MFSKIAIFAVTSIAIYFMIALGLIVSQSPSDFEFDDVTGGIQFADAVEADYSDLPDPTRYSARDGATLNYRYYASDNPSNRIIVLVHGSSWHGMQFHKMAAALSKQGQGDVIVPDLRGHGAEPVTRGDINYIGQLEDDLADLIIHLEAIFGADRKVILAGHSSGGGLMVRFASGRHGDMADGVVLLAPFLQHDAPTTRPNSGNWAFPALRRIIGLSMLNNFGITSLNYLPIIKFNIAEEVLDGRFGNTVTQEYSYRLNTGFAPRRDYKRDLSYLKQPVLLLVGSDDESFYADQYEPLMAPLVEDGEYQMIPSVNHIGIVLDDRAIKALSAWIESRF